MPISSLAQALTLFAIYFFLKNLPLPSFSAGALSAVDRLQVILCEPELAAPVGLEEPAAPPFFTAAATHEAT